MNLVATIEDSHDGIEEVSRGPAFTPERLAVAKMLHHNQFPYAPTPSSDPPRALVDMFRDIATKQIGLLTRRYRSMGGEDRITGALFDALQGDFEREGWSASVNVFHYSTRLKEPKNGADCGIVFDIQDSEGRRTYKTLLVQAKKSDFVPADADSLPGVKEQRALMRRYTTQGYILVYTPAGVSAFGPTDTKTPLAAANVLADGLACTRGDRENMAIANALDSRDILEVLVTGS